MNDKFIAHLIAKLSSLVNMSVYLAGLDSLVQLVNKEKLELNNYIMVGYDTSNSELVLFDGDSSEIRVNKNTSWFPSYYGTGWEDIIWMYM